jgi:hypothetical protein
VLMLEPVAAAWRRMSSYLLFSLSLIPLSELGKGGVGGQQCLSMSPYYRARKAHEVSSPSSPTGT